MPATKNLDILGNRATRTQWLKQMQHFSKGKGWSEASFDRKLKTLKERGRVTGGGAQGEFYSVVKSGCGPTGSGEPSDSREDGNGQNPVASPPTNGADLIGEAIRHVKQPKG
jgi:hypothetical protein